MKLDDKINLPRIGLENTFIARSAVEFCNLHCNHDAPIHHPDCLSNLWNSQGELVPVFVRKKTRRRNGNAADCC